MKRFFIGILFAIALMAGISCGPATASEDGASWIGVYHFECRDATGKIKWTETRKNALANEGQQEMLAVYLQGATAPTGYALGLSSMTFAKTTGYAGITNEPSGNGYARQTINRTAIAGGWPTLALDVGDYKATASTVTFTASGAGFGPVTSAMLVSATNNKLISYTALSTSRTLAAGDTLQVTYAVKLQ
jgi:hypothetical protein